MVSEELLKAQISFYIHLLNDVKDVLNRYENSPYISMAEVYRRQNEIKMYETIIELLKWVLNGPYDDIGGLRGI